MDEITIRAWQLIGAMGMPSAIMGLVVWRLQRMITRRDQKRDERDQDQKELMLVMLQTANASIALGEATARAVQRIPDAHCNGDMREALAYAATVKHRQKDFLTEKGIGAILD